MNKIYIISSESGYIGESLIAASNAKEANAMITDFKKSDLYNQYDSFGYGYVTEDDVIEDAEIPHSGFLHHGIRYLPL